MQLLTALGSSSDVVDNVKFFMFLLFTVVLDGVDGGVDLTGEADVVDVAVVAEFRCVWPLLFGGLGVLFVWLLEVTMTAAAAALLVNVVGDVLNVAIVAGVVGELPLLCFVAAATFGNAVEVAAAAPPLCDARVALLLCGGGSALPIMRLMRSKKPNESRFLLRAAAVGVALFLGGTFLSATAYAAVAVGHLKGE